MNIEELYAVLSTLLFKLFIFDEKEERKSIYKKSVKLLHDIHESHNSTIDTLDCVSKKILPLINENKQIKKELKLLKIAAEDKMDEYKKIISKIEKALQYEEGDET